MGETVKGDHYGESHLSWAIRAIIESMTGPYLVCICGKFKPGEAHPVFARIRCRGCGAWMTHKRIVEDGTR
jgi:hypothetical protein